MDGMKETAGIPEPRRTPAAPEETPVETIGSLMAECDGLTQQIQDEKDRMERFMLETGGESDASDRMQENIDSLKDTLAAAQDRLQALFDEQERKAFAPKRAAIKGPKKRASVKMRLAERNPEAAKREIPKKHKEKKSPGMDR